MSDAYENMTLREALSRFRRDNNLTECYENTGERSKTFLDRHDSIHVLFALDTSVPQEAMSDAFTMFGTDATWSDLKEYFSLPESKKLIAEFGWPKLLGLSLLSILKVIGTIFKARRMKRKWVWNGYELWLEPRCLQSARNSALTMNWLASLSDTTANADNPDGCLAARQ